MSPERETPKIIPAEDAYRLLRRLRGLVEGLIHDIRWRDAITYLEGLQMRHHAKEFNVPLEELKPAWEEMSSDERWSPLRLKSMVESLSAEECQEAVAGLEGILSSPKAKRERSAPDRTLEGKTIQERWKILLDEVDPWLEELAAKHNGKIPYHIWNSPEVQQIAKGYEARGIEFVYPNTNDIFDDNTMEKVGTDPEAGGDLGRIVRTAVPGAIFRTRKGELGADHEGGTRVGTVKAKVIVTASQR